MNPVRIISVLLTGIFIAYRISVNADGVSIVASGLDATIIVMATCLAVLVIWQDLEKFKAIRRFFVFTGTACCIAMAMLCGAVKYYYYRRAHMPVLVNGSHGSFFNTTTIALRTDGTYQVKSNGIEPYFFYGEYALHDSIVILKPDYIIGIPGSKLVIRPSENIIIRVDSSGKEIPNIERFRLYEDHRMQH